MLWQLLSCDRGLFFIKKTFDPENQGGGGGYFLKSGCAKKYVFHKFCGGGIGDLEKSREHTLKY